MWLEVDLCPCFLVACCVSCFESHLCVSLPIFQTFKSTKKKPKQAISERQILELLGEQGSPFVVRLYQAFQDDENLYMILHFAGGGDLFSQLEKRRRLPEEAVRFYAAEILLALEVLHRSRVCYRDLKPENVLLTIDGHILLTDMGMSKYVYVLCGPLSTVLDFHACLSLLQLLLHGLCLKLVH